MKKALVQVLILGLLAQIAVSSRSTMVWAQEQQQTNQQDQPGTLRDENKHEHDDLIGLVLHYLGIEQLAGGILGSATITVLLPTLTLMTPFVLTTMSSAGPNAQEVQLMKLSDDAAAYLGGQPASTLLGLTIQEIRINTVKESLKNGGNLTMYDAEKQFSDAKIVRKMFVIIQRALERVEEIREERKQSAPGFSEFMGENGNRESGNTQPQGSDNDAK